MKLKESKKKSENKREGGSSLNLPFRLTFTFNLFKTILIGLKVPIFLFYVWTEEIFLFGDLPVFVNTERHLKVVSYQYVYEMISLLIRLWYAR